MIVKCHARLWVLAKQTTSIPPKQHLTEAWMRSETIRMANSLSPSAHHHKRLTGNLGPLMIRYARVYSQVWRAEAASYDKKESCGWV